MSTELTVELIKARASTFDLETVFVLSLANCSQTNTQFNITSLLPLQHTTTSLALTLSALSSSTVCRPHLTLLTPRSVHQPPHTRPLAQPTHLSHTPHTRHLPTPPHTARTPQPAHFTHLTTTPPHTHHTHTTQQPAHIARRLARRMAVSGRASEASGGRGG